MCVCLFVLVFLVLGGFFEKTVSQNIIEGRKIKVLILCESIIVL